MFEPISYPRKPSTIELVTTPTITADIYTGDGQRFARLWRDVWTSIDHPQRRTLEQWWQHPVRIQVRDDWQFSHIELAVVQHRGGSMKFHGTNMERMGDDAVLDLIAHEIAHVHQYASGTIYDLMRYGKAGVEQDADDTAAWWGFSQDAIMDWKLANPIIDSDENVAMATGVA